MMKTSMKKIAALVTSVSGFFASATAVFAQVNIKITPPPGAIDPGTELSVIISNALRIVFAAALILVLIFLIIGAFQWITSGGDKEAVGKARSRITSALVGLAILALAFVIVQVVAQILGISSILNFSLPRIDQPVTVR